MGNDQKTSDLYITPFPGCEKACSVELSKKKLSKICLIYFKSLKFVLSRELFQPQIHPLL